MTEVVLDHARYLEITNDMAFKKVFSHKDILIDFLNTVLMRSEGEKIKKVEFIPTEQVPDRGQDKRSIFDLKCQDEQGNFLVVEMENKKEDFIAKRLQFYASLTYSKQLPAGKSYKELLPVIVIMISKQALFGNRVGYLHCHTTRDKVSNECLFKDLWYVVIELEKFTKKAEELRSVEDFWLYFLARSHEDKEPPSTIKDDLVLKAYAELEKFNWSAAQYDAYIRSMLLDQKEEGALKSKYKEGEERGEERGLQKGLQKGEKIGLQKGRKEGKLEGKIETAKKLSVRGMTIAEIADITGLSEKKVREIVMKKETP